MLSNYLAALILVTQALARPSAKDWQEFADSLDGRLHTALPVAAPCFPIVNGHNSTVDPEACAAVQAGYGSAEFRSARYPAYMWTQWETCQRTNEKCLLDTTNTSNPLASAVPCEQGYVSKYYVAVSGPEDIQKAFAFAAKTGIHLSIKASGHDYKGRSGSKGSLNLWTRNLTKLSHTPVFVPEGGNQSFLHAITLGAGVPTEDLYKFADDNNLTVVGGYAQTIAASGGWVMGGGHSILSPVLGLGVDRVLQFKIVTPDGKYRVANSFTNPDLFWALRGGGGSTFGVVLESTFLAEPRMKLQVAAMSFNRTATNYQPWLKLVVDESYKWGTEGWGGHIRTNAPGLINVNPLLTLEEATESVMNAADFVRAQNGSVVVEELPSWQAFFAKYVLTAEARPGVAATLTSRIIPAALFTTESGKAALTSTMIQMIDQYGVNPYIQVGTPFLFKGSANTTSVTPAWRDGLWLMAGQTSWQFNATIPEIRTQFQIAHNVTQLVQDISPASGAYFNEGDLYQTNHEENFWGPNYSALLAIKKKYDPYSLLDCWQCVGWKGAQNARYDCYLSLE
ncbi:isoamyl alcohol oxidase [Mycena albidolilacea]|uniref:Isoamyl alcohol oxidase n=1 Tax=Mycena albidolilacea TaxID=1033008 RepID=A0AAD6Z034_9AGAR|nr:isoamyl alcohol oxidase [Mycena albidolilacea]